MEDENSFEKIYRIVRRIPRGKVATYGQIARLAGNARWSRVVGYALHVNPEPGVIPCHRVLNRDGKPSSAFAFGGENRQIALLEAEGVKFEEDGCVDLGKYGWNGSMIATTLCYLEQDGKYLMLHRVKKHQDPNKGKWIGVGGHIENGERPEECAFREILEETGLSVLHLSFRGIVDFYNSQYDAERMYLYTSEDFTGELIECAEGELAWIPVGEVPKLNLWEGDRVFLNYLSEGKTGFHLELYYLGDDLVKVREISEDAAYPE
jgi:8-oxo-dGTP diphosphatase